MNDSVLGIVNRRQSVHSTVLPLGKSVVENIKGQPAWFQHAASTATLRSSSHIHETCMNTAARFVDMLAIGQ